MKTIYLDCFAGISGDMLVGALIDLGVEPDALRAELAKLPLTGYRLDITRANKRGIQAVQFKVLLTGEGQEHLADSEFKELKLPEDVAHEEVHAQEHEHESGHHHEHGHEHPHDHAHDHAHEHEHQHQHVHDHGHEHVHTHRALPDILALIESSGLSLGVKARAARVFTRLAEAEGKVHGLPMDEVHFHEVGGVDAIVDVLSALIGLEMLGVERVLASPLHLGSGFIKIQHGIYPVPAPATANLLAGVPVYSSAAQGELVTPTGAAVLSTLAESYGPLPVMTLQAIGYGAGTRERDFPNVLRALLGDCGETSLPPSGAVRKSREPYPEQHEAEVGESGYHVNDAVVIEASIDDMSPQLYENLMERLLEAGALDVLYVPVQMKKGRPATLVQVLAAPESVDELAKVIFRESTSIGLRTYPVTKRMLQRERITVQTRFGAVRVKVSRLGDAIVNISLEYEDCRALARQLNLPLKEVCDAARVSASRQLNLD